MVRQSNGKLHLLSALEVLHAGEGDFNDGGGLSLRVRAGASASWVLRFTSPSGRRREMGLGIANRDTQKLAGASLQLARDLAAVARGDLKHGIDPIDARDAKRAESRANIERKKAEQARERRTLARVARDYHERVIEPSRSTKHGADWINSLETHVPADLWHRPIDEVSAPDLLTPMLALQHKIPETASRIRQRLDAVFEDAAFHGYATTNPAAAIRRKLREAHSRQERGAFRALPFKEAPAFMARLRQSEGIAARCLEFAVLTVARTGEVLGAQWSELDFELATWTVPGERMKAGAPNIVHLSDRRAGDSQRSARYARSLAFRLTDRRRSTDQQYGDACDARSTRHA
jgi:integrase